MWSQNLIGLDITLGYLRRNAGGSDDLNDIILDAFLEQKYSFHLRATF
jgi:hypothetical protein